MYTLMESDFKNRPSLLRAADIVGCKRRKISPLVPISRSTLWAWVKAGKFPQPIRFNGVTAWRVADVMRFLHSGGVE